MRVKIWLWNMDHTAVVIQEFSWDILLLIFTVKLCIGSMWIQANHRIPPLLRLQTTKLLFKSTEGGFHTQNIIGVAEEELIQSYKESIFKKAKNSKMLLSLWKSNQRLNRYCLLNLLGNNTVISKVSKTMSENEFIDGVLNEPVLVAITTAPDK